jgi:hypothetical protein
VAGLWQPYWRANTAYTVSAVVIPTAAAFAGWTWRCTAPGTSGGTEPAWPDPTISPTIADGGVTWSVGTGARQAFQYGLKSVVTTFMAANPTIVRSVFTARPRSLLTAEQPCFYIGDMSESIDTSQGVRTRNFSGFSAFLTDTMGEQQESNDRMNFAADVFADLFTANYHAAGGYSLFTHVGTNDTEIDDNGAFFPALEFVFAPSKIAEGRT